MSVIVTLQVVSRAEILVAKVQQLTRSEQDTNPVVSDSIQAEFEDKGKVLQLVDHLGELKFREFHSGILVHQGHIRQSSWSGLNWSTSRAHDSSHPWIACAMA